MYQTTTRLAGASQQTAVTKEGLTIQSSSLATRFKTIIGYGTSTLRKNLTKHILVNHYE